MIFWYPLGRNVGFIGEEKNSNAPAENSGRSIRSQSHYRPLSEPSRKDWMEHISSCDDVNMLDKNINIIKEDREIILEASREVGLEVNTENYTYVFVFLHQNAGQCHNLLTANKSFEDVSKVK
jgi:hypothetical protein